MAMTGKIKESDKDVDHQEFRVHSFYVLFGDRTKFELRISRLQKNTQRKEGPRCVESIF